jgi:aminocarboxymuconate-semialdehyde decarboxylase
MVSNKPPTEYLNQLYFDALAFTPKALRHLVAQVGVGQVILTSDHRYFWERHPVDPVFATTSLADPQKSAILGGKAACWLGLKA